MFLFVPPPLLPGLLPTLALTELVEELAIEGGELRGCGLLPPEPTQHLQVHNAQVSATAIGLVQILDSDVVSLPQRHTLVDKKAERGHISLSRGHGRVMDHLLLEGRPHGGLQLPDLLEIPQAIPIWGEKA